MRNMSVGFDTGEVSAMANSAITATYGGLLLFGVTLADHVPEVAITGLGLGLFLSGGAPLYNRLAGYFN